MQNAGGFDMNKFLNLSEELHRYDRLVRKIRNLGQAKASRDFHVFDIRFKLALGLHISFDSTISYTKTKSTRMTYKSLMELTELWFAYEALYAWCKRWGLLKPSGHMANPFSKETIATLGLEGISTLIEEAYKKHIICSAKRRDDFCSYIEHLSFSVKTSKPQKARLSELRESVLTLEAPSMTLWLTLIYAIRNMHVHEADTAKSGVAYYSTKFAVLLASKDIMTAYLFAISRKLLNYEIKNLSHN